MNRIQRRSLFPLLLVLVAAGCATTPDAVSRNPESMAKAAEEFQTSGRYEDAIAQWKKVRESYASPELTTEAELKIADAQFADKSYIEAAASYEEFRKLHPNHEKSPYALYRQALSQYEQITGIDTDQTPVSNAVTLFESFLRIYPSSEYAAEVRNKLEVCRLKQVEHEIYVGRFYYRTDQYGAAIKRLEETLKKYPRSPAHDETLFYLGSAYIRTGDKAKGRDAFQRLFAEYRTSKYVDEARKFMDKNF
ncbi:outer membrane protein assembly factor BamD [Geobacter hydrogenophilus]|uniref:Outer membrane protein assembly factor BamD n=1 Tax=Geobacter hydrogenophilus TaxID=40983 RepID=A0A9W6LAU6_9BACT|nr:outer membrane protein assembly factor BamD [Geobacter hydrogenophilus]MBT0893789.1 outer membrane protein assembly factor BamD [Geobacter hydrogenophilus]GLI37513.1 outer membrane protein assembly factor BamD [Geobacter hydrogenophilus]